MDFKKDFPIFKNNPELVFFDSTATSQKPSHVIDAIKNYLETDYSNIHRGMYDIAINSEKLYNDSKKKVAENIWADDYKEVIYTFNSTYALNLLSSSIKKSWILKAGDKVLLTIAEHHANLVPWLILKDEIGIEIDYVNVDENYDLDLDDFDKKYDEKVKIISMTQVSNVIGQVFDLEEIWKRKRVDTLFIIDWSQSVPHFKVDVKKLNCDAMFFTWHKVFADSGIWVLWWKSELLNSLTPSFSWGGSIWEVTCSSYTSAKLPDKFEPGTPNVTWAVSLLKAFEYIEQIWWYEVLEKVEHDLVVYFLEKLKDFTKLKLIGWTISTKRVGVFSIVVDWYHSHDVSEIMAENNIAVRSWKHCAHPLFNTIWESNSIRVSFHIYNTKSDIDKFFEVLKILK